MMGDICTAGSRKAGRNRLVAIWHSPRADASDPLSTCCLTGLCLHGLQIPTGISPSYPCRQSHRGVSLARLRFQSPGQKIIMYVL